MKESDEYYSYFEKLMRAAPETVTREAPEYQALSAHYPHLSEHIRLRKELERLKQELQTAKERSRRLQVNREIEDIVGRLRRQDTLMRLYGESKRLGDYKTRFLITSVKQRISSIVLRAQLRIRGLYLNLQKRLQEQSRKARYRRASTLPPSLLDMRSLDPVDKSLALRDWIEKRKVRTQRRKLAGPVEAGQPAR